MGISFSTFLGMGISLIFADLQAIMGPLPAFSSALLPGAFRRKQRGFDVGRLEALQDLGQIAK